MKTFLRTIKGQKYLFTPIAGGGYEITKAGDKKAFARTRNRSFQKRSRLGMWSNVPRHNDDDTFTDLIVFMIIMDVLEPSYAEEYASEVESAGYDISSVDEGNEDVSEDSYAGGMAGSHEDEPSSFSEVNDSNTDSEDNSRRSTPDPIPASSSRSSRFDDSEDRSSGGGYSSDSSSSSSSSSSDYGSSSSSSSSDSGGGD